MSEVRRSGLKPLRSSINIINNDKSLVESRKSLNRPSIDKCEPKVSMTEKIESNTPTTKPTNMRSVKSSVKSTSKSSMIKSTVKESMNQSHQKAPVKKFSRQTTLTSNCQIKKSGAYNLEKTKVKKAIKTILNREQRIKQWLTSKEPVEDPEYWRLTSERLSKELFETLDQVDELELENELLIAELEQMSKLAEKAYKLNTLFKKIGLSKLLMMKDDSINRTLNSTGESDSTFDDSTNRTIDSTHE